MDDPNDRTSVLQEFTKAGATVEQLRGKQSIRFDLESLKRFYLYDVLLHELGHHIDDRVFSRPVNDAERYAEWFVREQARVRTQIPPLRDYNHDNRSPDDDSRAVSDGGAFSPFIICISSFDIPFPFSSIYSG